jgi:mRNA-degrading endonuclease toxin of MazEF toxin-antitoxin module
VGSPASAAPLRLSVLARAELTPVLVVGRDTAISTTGVVAATTTVVVAGSTTGVVTSSTGTRSATTGVALVAATAPASA